MSDTSNSTPDDSPLNSPLNSEAEKGSSSTAEHKYLGAQRPVQSPTDRPRLSCEFFPPKTPAGMRSVGSVVEKLNELQPEFYSCTYGAGGTTRQGTQETIAQLTELGVNAAPHLSIGSDDKQTIFDLLDTYRASGVNRIVALRGDSPSGMGPTRIARNAETLVNWIREHSGDYFQIEVAAYPEIHPDAESPEQDLRYFAAKVGAGATAAITHFF